MPLELKERDVTRQVKDFLGFRGWRAIRMMRTVVPGAFQVGEPGMPDFLFLRYFKDAKTLALWIEFKRPKGKTGAHQRAWQQREQALNATVVMVDNLDQFIEWYQVKFGWLHGPKGIGQLEVPGLR